MKHLKLLFTSALACTVFISNAQKTEVGIRAGLTSNIPFGELRGATPQVYYTQIKTFSFVQISSA